MNYDIYDRGYEKNAKLRREAKIMLQNEARIKNRFKKHEDELFGFFILAGIAVSIALLTKNIALTGLMALVVCLFLAKIDNVFLRIPAVLLAWPFVIIPALVENKNIILRVLGYVIMIGIAVFLFIVLDIYNLIILP